MEQQGKQDGGPLFDRFVTENNDGNQRQQKQSGTIPSVSIKEPNNWKEQVEAILQPSLSAAEARVMLMMQQFVESIESQILSALKQAAMDIIEHLGKEAAMRVLVAERKAVHFEQDLISTKQEALTMLVRLKQSMNTQITEAERACQIERRRTKEMEEKLIIAQDTVKKLMNELKRKGVLEQMQKMAQPFDEHCTVQMYSPTDYSTMQVTSSSRQLPEQIFIGKPYLPSIIMKNKEKAIPANGFDHGIYGETINVSIADACPVSEGNEIRESLSTENDLLPYSVDKRRVGGEASHRGPTVMPDKNSAQKQNAGYFLRQSTLLVTCTGKSGSCDGGLVQMEGKSSPSTKSDASLGTEDKTVGTDKITVRVGSVVKQKDLASFPEIYNASFLSQDREGKTWGSESSKTSGGDEKPAASGMENLGMTFEDKEGDVARPFFNWHVKQKYSTEDDCRTSTKLVDDVTSVQSILCSSHAYSSLENAGITLETAGNQVGGEGGVLTKAIQSDEKTRLLVHSNIMKQECDKAIAISKPYAIEDLKNNPGLMRDIDAGQISETKISMSALDQHVRSRLTKFTFQRKRRRESPFQQNGNTIQEEKDPKKGETKQHDYFPIVLSGKLPEKHRTTLVSQKSALVAESSRDRRLMQGARQLVSLSEKKSW